MPEFVYCGAHDAVDLEGHGSVPNGESVTVAAEEAEGLRGRDDWREKKPATTRKSKEG